MKIQYKNLQQIVFFSIILISTSFTQKQLVIGAYGSSDTLNLQEAKREWLQNMDWINYLSNAHHKTWEAFNSDTNVHSLDLRHYAGKDTLLNGRYYRTNQTAPVNSLLLYGPSIWRSYPNYEDKGYLQDTRYRMIVDELMLDTIKYRVDFHIKRLPGKHEIRKVDDTLCIVKVILNYEVDGVTCDSVISKAVRSGDLSDELICYISYNMGFLENNSTSIQSVENCGTEKRYKGTEFIVENRTTSEVYAIEKVEVSDSFIWNRYFSTTGELPRLERLIDYLNSCKSAYYFKDSEQGSYPDFTILPSGNTIESGDVVRILKESITFLYKSGFVKPCTTPQKSLITSTKLAD
jgi:hypothetical protein